MTAPAATEQEFAAVVASLGAVEVHILTRGLERAVSATSDEAHDAAFTATLDLLHKYRRGEVLTLAELEL